MFGFPGEKKKINGEKKNLKSRGHVLLFFGPSAPGSAHTHSLVMAEDGPPAGPEFSAGGSGDFSHTEARLGVPNLQDLRGMLRVTVCAVRHIPLVPAPQPPTTLDAAPDGDAASPPARKGEGESPPRRGRGLRGSPYLKMQLGLHQFQTMDPAFVAPIEEGAEPELEWGETLSFELSGDMRELRVFLMNWMWPFAKGPQGFVRIPIGELANNKWANATRMLTKRLLTGKDETPLKCKNEYTNIEFRVVYEPGSSMLLSSSAIDQEAPVLHTGAMMTCQLCRRWVFVTARPTPSLEKKAIKVKSQRKILLWLRDYNIQGALHVARLEVPRSQFALPAFVFGPEATFSGPVRNFVAVVMQDTALKERLGEMKALNHCQKLNSWTPIYCSAEGRGDGLVEAVRYRASPPASS